MTNCCDDYGNCRQGRDCPVRAAKYHPTLPIAAAPLLKPQASPNRKRPPGYLVLLGVLVFIGGALALLAL